MANQDEVGNNATNAFSTIVGVLMSLLAILMTIPVAPMLLFARDARDLTGGIAGTIVILSMLVTGAVLVLREKTPVPMLRAFYFGMGGLSLLVGVGVLGSGIYSISTGVAVQKGALMMPVLFIVLGGVWIQRGWNIGHNVQHEVDPA